MSKARAKAESARAIADKLRERRGVKHEDAKLESSEDGEGLHVDYFRGKDLVRWLQENGSKLDPVLGSLAGKPADETASELISLFISCGLLYKTERKFKRPKPGRTRLVKYPRTLLLVRDNTWDETAFYAWRYDKPITIWYWLASVAVPVVVILVCLFPLAPWWARIGLVYTLMAVLLLLLVVLAARYLLFAAVWVASGASLWIFPNMMSDKVGLLDAFTPVVTFTKAKSLKEQWQARLATALLLGGVLWLLASHSPDLTHLGDDMTKAHDSFMEYMDKMYSKDKSFLAGNTTTGNSSSTGGTRHTASGPM